MGFYLFWLVFIEAFATMSAPDFTLLNPPHGGKIAFCPAQTGKGSYPGIVWLPGYGSTMAGEKITAIAHWAADHEVGLTRFDYQACGASPGDFASTTLGLWRRDSEFVFETQTSGAQLLVGSSMGAWLALHLALRWPERVKALLLLAPAPDFSQRLWQNLDNDQLEMLCRHEQIMLPGGLVLTRDFILEARDHLLLTRPLPVQCPVHILHGMQDEAVPLSSVMRLCARLIAPHVRLELIKADHRFSGVQAQALMLKRLGQLVFSSAKQATSPSR